MHIIARDVGRPFIQVHGYCFSVAEIQMPCRMDDGIKFESHGRQVDAQPVIRQGQGAEPVQPLSLEVDGTARCGLHLYQERILGKQSAAIAPYQRGYSINTHVFRSRDWGEKREGTQQFQAEPFGQIALAQVSVTTRWHRPPSVRLSWRRTLKRDLILAGSVLGGRGWPAG